MRLKRFRALVLRTFLIFFGASSMWSLLPALAGLNLHMTASTTGMLMGAIGAGAVAGGYMLPLLKERFGVDRLTRFAAAQLALALLLAISPGSHMTIWLSMTLTGVGWAQIVSGLNGAAQTMFPCHICARAISAYLMGMYGGTAAGSWVWGAVSGSSGIESAFCTAAAILLTTALVTTFLPIEEAEIPKCTT